MLFPQEVQITINNDIFQSVIRQKTKPFDLFSPGRLGGDLEKWRRNLSAKENYRNLYSNCGGNPGKCVTVDVNPFNFAEAEETINVDFQYIENPLRFIERIDTWVQPMDDERDMLFSLLKSHPEWKKKIFFHNAY